MFYRRSTSNRGQAGRQEIYVLYDPKPLFTIALCQRTNGRQEFPRRSLFGVMNRVPGVRNARLANPIVDYWDADAFFFG
jgi:hypothetical protein